MQGQRVSGFNSILAVSSIEIAKKYYNTELKKETALRSQRLNITPIFKQIPKMYSLLRILI